MALLLYVEVAQHAHLDRSVMLSRQGHMMYAVPTARLTPRPNGARGLRLAGML